jgi:hypothetical protein
MGVRKRRRTRSDEGGRRLDITGGYNLGPFAPEHGAYTIEGQLERQQLFMDGVRRARGAKRVVAMALVVIMLGSIAATLVVYFSHLFW